MLQKSHPGYECDHDDESPSDASNLQLKEGPAPDVAVSNTANDKIKGKFKKNKASGKPFPKVAKDPQFLAAVEKAQTFQKYSDAAYLPNESVPEAWDWRNVAGYDFTDDLKDQGKCGSCYTVSFVQSVNSRLKIKYGQKAREVPKVATQQILSCNYLQEGCNGGQGFFNGVWAQKASFVDEECAPYHPSLLVNKNQCSKHKDCPSVARVTKSCYLGEGKFRADEMDIKKELVMHGPVVTSFNVDDSYSFKQAGKFDAEEDVSWSYYHSGVLKQD